MQQLSAQDAQFLHLETANQRTQVMAVNVYDPSTAPDELVTFKDIIAHVESRMDQSPIFRRRLHWPPLGVDHPYWVEDKHFDVEAHISHARLPDPGDWRQFCIMLARHHSRPLDMNRPLWDMLVIEGLGRVEGFADGSFAIATRTHHAAVDGTSLNHLLGSLTDKDLAGTPVLARRSEAIELGNRPNVWSTMTRAAASHAQAPLKVARLVGGLTPKLVAAAPKLVNGDRSGLGVNAPYTRFNETLSPHRVFDALTVRLDDIKAIRRLASGATINDVLLTVVAGALRAYLMEHGELPQSSLVGLVPVNSRASAQDNVTSGNNISAMTVKLWTDVSDPVARLKEVHKTTTRTKSSDAGLTARIFMDTAKVLPSAQLSVLTKLMNLPGMMPRISNVNVSNTMGPNVPMYLLGATMTHLYGMAPLAQGVGLFIATPSYNGALSFNITCDRGIMPDVAFFRECLRTCFETLLDEALSNGAA